MPNSTIKVKEVLGGRPFKSAEQLITADFPAGNTNEAKNIRDLFINDFLYLNERDRKKVLNHRSMEDVWNIYTNVHHRAEKSKDKNIIKELANNYNEVFKEYLNKIMLNEAMEFINNKNNAQQIPAELKNSDTFKNLGSIANIRYSDTQANQCAISIQEKVLRIPTDSIDKCAQSAIKNKLFSKPYNNEKDFLYKFLLLNKSNQQSVLNSKTLQELDQIKKGLTDLKKSSFFQIREQTDKLTNAISNVENIIQNQKMRLQQRPTQQRSRQQEHNNARSQYHKQMAPTAEPPIQPFIQTTQKKNSGTDYEMGIQFSEKKKGTDYEMGGLRPDPTESELLDNGQFTEFLSARTQRLMKIDIDCIHKNDDANPAKQSKIEEFLAHYIMLPEDKKDQILLKKLEHKGQLYNLCLGFKNLLEDLLTPGFAQIKAQEFEKSADKLFLLHFDKVKNEYLKTFNWYLTDDLLNKNIIKQETRISEIANNLEKTHFDQLKPEDKEVFLKQFLLLHSSEQTDIMKSKDPSEQKIIYQELNSLNKEEIYELKVQQVQNDLKLFIPDLEAEPPRFGR